MATPSLRIPKNKERITSYMNDYNFDSIVYDEPKYATVLFNSHAEIKSVILPSLLKSLFFKEKYINPNYTSRNIEKPIKSYDSSSRFHLKGG